MQQAPVRSLWNQNKKRRFTNSFGLWQICRLLFFWEAVLRKVILTPGTRNEIDIQVEKIIRGLGHPEPPLDLDAVFKLQQLDPQYYRTSEDGVVRETISRVKIGTKLIFERPTRIWDAIKTANLKALWIPERALSRQPAHAHYRTGRERRRRSNDHGHCRARLEADAQAL